MSRSMKAGRKKLVAIFLCDDESATVFVGNIFMYLGMLLTNAVDKKFRQLGVEFDGYMLLLYVSEMTGRIGCFKCYRQAVSSP